MPMLPHYSGGFRPGRGVPLRPDRPTFLRGKPMAVPTDVTGIRLWLRPDDLATADGTQVSGTIPDASGFGNNATSVAAHQPTMRTGALNGHNVLEFAGNQAINGSNILTGDFTVFQLVKPTAWGGQDKYYGTACDLYNTEASGSANDYGSAVGLTGHVVFGTGSPDTFLVGNQLTLSSWYVVTFDRVQSTGVMRGWVNGLPTGSITNNTSTLNASSTWAFGGSTLLNEAWYTGQMAQIIGYNRSLSTVERQFVEAYLWGLMGPLATPYFFQNAHRRRQPGFRAAIY